MSNISKPSFFFGYYRPWNKNVNWYESWLDYNRDNQRSQYVSQMIVSGIKEVNTDNINCLREINTSISNGFQNLQSELQSIDDNLFTINATLEEGFYDLKQNQIKQVQLAVATNILLVDIKTLITFSDSEKERYESIREGLKFIANVQRDDDYYDDAFRSFLKAVDLKPTDYFSLFFLGYINLFSRKHFNPDKAIEYIKKTLKYALIDDNNDIKVLNEFYSKVDEGFSGVNLINSAYLLLSQCYYLIGDFESALKNSLLISEDSFQNNFTYQLKYASRANDERSIIDIIDKIFKNYLQNYEDVFLELDVVNNLFSLNYIRKIINGIDASYLKLRSTYENYDEDYEITNKLKKIFSKDLSIIDKKKIIDSYSQPIIESEIVKQIDFEKFVNEELSIIENNYSHFLQIKEKDNSAKNELQSKINSLTNSRHSIRDYLNYIMIGYIIFSILVVIYFFLKNDSIATAIGQNIVVIIVEVVIGFVIYVLFSLFGAGIEKILENRISKKRKLENKVIYQSDSNRKSLIAKIKEAKESLEYHIDQNSKYEYSKAFRERIKKIRF